MFLSTQEQQILSSYRSNFDNFISNILTESHTSKSGQRVYRVGQKSKLLILSEYVNKTEKIGGVWTKTNICRENWALSDIFTRIILRHNCFVFKHSMIKTVNEITDRQTRTSLRKHDVIKVCSKEYLTSHE